MHSSSILSTQRRAAPPSALKPVLLPRVSLSDPAHLVMTDFAREPSITVKEERRIDEALEDMVRFGVRALLVVHGDTVTGLITSYDIQGERPLQFLQSSTYTRHDEIMVGHVMTPWERLPMLDWDSVRLASVSEVRESFSRTGATHLTVVQSGDDGSSVVRGLFSRTRLERQLAAV